jgi:hypothetical protein
MVVTDDKADAFESDGDNNDSFTAPDTANVEGETEKNESNADSIQDPNQDSTPTATNQDAPTATNQDADAEQPNVVPFDLDHDNPTTNLNSQDDAVLTLGDQAELMRWHYRLGHLPFANI